MNNCKICCLTNDKASWSINPFSYLFNKFWSNEQLVDIVGFNKPSFNLSDNFNFISIASDNWPSNMWTNQLFTYLGRIEEDYVILFLEDYWLDKPVNIECVEAMVDYIQTDNSILRIDLTNDRSQHNTAILHDQYLGYEIIRTPANTRYQMSFQVGCWSKKRLLEVLVPNEDAWQTEIEGTKRLRKPQFKDFKVLGTKEYPVHYKPVLRRNRVGIQGYKQFSLELRRELDKLIPKEIVK